MGFAGGWLTGWAAYSDAVRDAFGAAPERIAGFVFIGTPSRARSTSGRAPIWIALSGNGQFRTRRAASVAVLRQHDSARAATTARSTSGCAATIAAAILRGDYRAGDQLPSVRALAAEHGANPLTVAKAYQSFQDDGYVEVRRGVGMFVLPGAAERLRIAERESFVTQQWPRIRDHIDLLGLDAKELLERVPG